MGVMAQAGKLAAAGRGGDAIALVEREANGGDVEALQALAHWRLFGVYVARDEALARELLRRAGEAGSIEAARQYATLVGNGTGGAGDPGAGRALLARLASYDPDSARQIKLLDAMPPAESATDLPTEELSVDPPVRLVRRLLSGDECRYIMTRAEPALRPSAIVDPRTGRPMPDPLRTSSGTNFGPTDEDLVVHALNRRIAAATGTQVESGEPLHILRYLPGEQYRPHLDALPGVGNQRHWTALIYLNKGYGGGETRFDMLGIAAKGQIGDALVFRDVTADGRGDPRTRHAGLPVTDGVKWLATRWIRQRRYSPWDRD